jgi:hypothetical protein
MKKLIQSLVVFCLLGALAFLASCAPAMEAPATEAPAAEAPSETEAPTWSTAAPTQTIQNIYMLELEYPGSMRLGDSDVVVVSLFNTESGYIIEAEFPDHTLTTQKLTVAQLPDYRTYATGTLLGTGFVILPEHEQRYEISEGQSITWHWSISPNSAGRHRLSLLVSLAWVPEKAAAGPIKEQLLFSRSIEIRVNSFLGLERSQALMSGFIGLLFGSGLGLGALFWRKPASIRFRVEKPNPRLVIESSPSLQLNTKHASLLKALFHSYSRLMLTGDFMSGYSGARTYMALPIRENGQADAATIVKIGQRSAIEKEVSNYEKYVKNRLPPITARIQQDPVSLPSGDLAAVQYTFISKTGDLPISLRQALLKDPNPDHLERLYDTFGPGWWMQREAYSFRVASEYDRLLPPHYVLKPLESKAPHQKHISDQNLPQNQQLKTGDIVSVGRFQSYEFRTDGKSLTLFGQAQNNGEGLRLRWLSNKPPDRSLARVTANRSELLESYCSGMDHLGYPDPLEKLDALLAETQRGTRSIIHGDLNLENILVGPGDLIWLIDFAETRPGHTLFDFAKLNAEIIGHVYATRIPDPRDFATRLSNGKLPLCSTLNQIASHCLFNPNKPREYDLACYFACLGAMKYQNLGLAAKKHLYLAASALSQRL